MRLKSIKLAGFKSFVDPTTVDLPSQLCAVVGPNGCGKSNIIDAVRWVMGESSAKNLRGESMTDVIFNGSTHRKPVGQCSIELIFDNSDGRLSGEYAAYSEVSIKRRVTREGRSDYFLNNTKCRRRDITDIFLGTGLGARSYSIIEQGMISQLIEAKPEELRVYIEEAAGISKYKERRKETERRMSHTQENLDRLGDLREELERQLSHLHQQAQIAEKYTDLKKQERLLKAQLQALKWRVLDQELSSQKDQLSQQEIKLDSETADLRAIDAKIEEIRIQHTERNDQFNIVQAEFYELSGDISRQEQMITYSEERNVQLQQDIQQAKDDYDTAEDSLRKDEQVLISLKNELEQKAPMLAELQEETELLADNLEEAETSIYQWQQQFDQFSEQMSGTKQQAEVEQSKVQQFDQQLQQLDQRYQRLQDETKSLASDIEEDDTAQLQLLVEEQLIKCAEQEDRLSTTSVAIETERALVKNLQQDLIDQQGQLQTAEARRTSLEALQQAALEKNDDTMLEWLKNYGLDKSPRLADIITVADGYQDIVELVLAADLQSICTDNLNHHQAALTTLNVGEARLIQTDYKNTNMVEKHTDHTELPLQSLLSVVEPPQLVAGFLSGIYICENLHEALQHREKLDQRESIVTLDKHWIGVNFIRAFRDYDEIQGVLSRRDELNDLEGLIKRKASQVEKLKTTHQDSSEKLQALELQRADYQNRLNAANRQLADSQANASRAQSKFEQLDIRRQNNQTELEEIEQQIELEQEKLSESRLALQNALDIMAEQMSEKETLLHSKQLLIDQRDQARANYQSSQKRVHELALEKSSIEAQYEALGQSKTRLFDQLEEFKKRVDYLKNQLSENETPIEELKEALAEKLEKRLDIEHALAKARSDVSDIEHQLRENEQQKILLIQQIETTRNHLEQYRLASQTQTVRRSTLEDQLRDDQFHLETVLNTLDDKANEPEWEQKVAKTAQKIQRLGPINLAAVDEYKSQSERKQYLDSQHEDLESALETLADAIKKIDRETRTRFKETFDLVNQGVQELFPKMFGGGHAYLELIGEDLLDTGIAIMARPPGKRNSTIHLLSGGEKALTAIALVFSIFRLNPAPFCMLDEVDAPLDDANVGRLCNLVKEMSKKVQFIYITHNKVSMEMSEQLMGVTMQEPGVSRLVSVDVEEAVALAGA